jgi:hypothetical protein
MEASYSTTLDTAFVIRPEELTRLGKLLETHVGNVKCRADCSDGISRDFSDINDLVQYENPRSKEIVSLHLVARSGDLLKNATIDLSSSKWRSITLDFRAGEDAVSGLKAGTLDIIDGSRPWYGIVRNVDFIFIGLAAFALLWLSVLIAAARSRIVSATKKASEGSSTKVLAMGQLLIVVVMLAIVSVGVAFNFFRDSWFPRAVFAIGQGRSRFETLERFQWNFLIAITASVVAGIAILAVQACRKRS